MEVKDLQRQIIDAERLADWGRVIVSQSDQIQSLIKENEELKRQLAEKEVSDAH